jgi:transposase-like protein
VAPGEAQSDPEVPARAKPARAYTARYKAEVLAEYERLDKEGKGALLRREGLYSSLISVWRKQRDRGALQALAQPTGRPSVDPAERWREVRRVRDPRWESPRRHPGRCKCPDPESPCARSQNFSDWPLARD